MFLADASNALLVTGALTLCLTLIIRLCWRRGKHLEEP